MFRDGGREGGRRGKRGRRKGGFVREREKESYLTLNGIMYSKSEWFYK